MASINQARRLSPTLQFRQEWWGPLFALLAALAGLLIGGASNTSYAELSVQLIFLGACALLALRHPLAGLLLAILIQPFIFFLYLVVNMGAGIPDVTLGRALVPAVFALVLAQGAIGKRKLLRLTALDFAMALTGLAMIVAGLRGRYVTVSLQWVFDMFLTAYAVYFIAKNLIQTQTALRSVLWVVAAVGGYTGLYGLFAQITGISLFLPDGRLWAYNLEFYTESLRLIRGLFDSPHIFGTVYGLVIPVQFYLFVKARSPQARLLAGIFLLLSLSGLFLVYRRTSYLALGAGLLVLFFVFPRFRRYFAPVLVVIAVVAWLYTDEIGDSAVVRERVGQRADTLNGRLDLWDVALSYASREPWFGYGNGGFLQRSGLSAIESHYLWILVDGGLIALIPFLLVFVLMLRLSWRLYHAPGKSLVESDLIGVFVATLATYLVNLSTAVINHDFPHVLFFLLAGAVLGAQEGRLQNSETSPALDPLAQPRLAGWEQPSR